MKLIPLNKNKYAIIDDEDYETLSRYSWSVICTKKGKEYAVRWIPGSIKFMHREILNAPTNRIVDHKDGNGLNNQKGNIRICTYSQNNASARKRTGCASIYKGVEWSRSKRKWRSRIGVSKGRKVHIGYFSNERDAAIAYDKKAKEVYGEFAYINFP